MYLKYFIFLLLFHKSTLILAQKSEPNLYFYVKINQKKICRHLEVEIHDDTLRYFDPLNIDYTFDITDSIAESPNFNIDNYPPVDTIVYDRSFLQDIIWKKYKRDSIVFTVNGKSNALIFDKNTFTKSCYFPSNQNPKSYGYNLYNVNKSDVTTVYLGKRTLVAFGRIKRVYQFRFTYDFLTSDESWYHDLYIDRKDGLPFGFDEAFVVRYYNGDELDERIIRYKNYRRKSERFWRKHIE